MSVDNFVNNFKKKVLKSLVNQKKRVIFTM